MSIRVRALVAGLAGLACLVVGLASAAGSAPVPGPPSSPGAVDRARAEIAHAAQGSVPIFAMVRNGDSFTVLRARSTVAGAAALRARLRAIPGVVSADVDGVVHAATLDDPDFPQQWAFNAVDYQSAWATANGTTVTVAVLDTGVLAAHEDLTGSILNGADCLSASTSSNCTSGTGVGDSDPNGHGTHVAGIIAAHVNNGLGIAGAAPGVHILPVRVLDSTGSGSDSGVAAGIVWATDHGANVISMSLTGGADSGEQQAVAYAQSHHVIVVAAAGNDYLSTNQPQYPASYSGVVSVGSISNQGNGVYARSSFSNTVSNVALMAPGNSIISTYSTSTSSYATLSGTSMATPYVSASVAILLSAGVSSADVVHDLEATATPLADSAGLGSPTGFGIVNPVAALTTFVNTTTSTGPASTTSTSISGTSTTSTLASTTSTTAGPTTTTTVPKSTPNSTPPAVQSGYWVVGRDGRVRGFGHPTYGDRYGKSNVPIVAMAATPTGKGYWLAGADGAVYPFGDAKFYGSFAGKRLNAPIVAMAATRTGAGYWLMGADGGIFGYGDARFYGSTGSMKLKAPVLDLAPTPTGKGYWLVAADGGIFGYGDARFYGSTGSMQLARPVTSMSPDDAGKGYWLIASDGGVFGFGGVRFYGNPLTLGVHKTIVRLRATRTGGGYWILANDGSVYAFGDAKSHGWTAIPNAVDIAVQ